MVGLVDIAPSVEKVSIGGSQVDVPGVSARGIAMLFQRFPEIQKMIATRKLDADRILDMSDELIHAIIAAGVGFPGAPEQEAAASRLSLDDKATLIEAIFRVTFPNGLGPFAEKIAALGAVISGDRSATVPDTK